MATPVLSAFGRKPTTEKVKIVFSKWSLIGQQETFAVLKEPPVIDSSVSSET